MVKIELEGTALLLKYVPVQENESIEEIDEYFWEENYDLFCLLSDIVVTADGDDITKQKGKYIVVPDMIHSELATEQRPVLARLMTEEAYYHAYAELDIDDFDPKKLQLRKCTYEFDDIPYAIDACHVVYDGELVQLEDCEDYSWECDDVDDAPTFYIE